MGGNPVNLGLDHVTTMTIRLDEQHVIGQTPRGLRRVSPVLSGTFDGPRLRGEVLPGRDDWNLALPDLDHRRPGGHPLFGTVMGSNCWARQCLPPRATDRSPSASPM